MTTCTHVIKVATHEDQIHLEVHNEHSSLVYVPDVHLYWNCEVW